MKLDGEKMSLILRCRTTKLERKMAVRVEMWYKKNVE